MNENAREYLKVARDYLIIGDKEQAYVHYGKVLLDYDPENEEAIFFAACFNYQDCLEKGDFSAAATAFKAMTNCLENAVKHIKESELEDIMKEIILTEMVNCYLPITRYLFRNRYSVKTIPSDVLIQTGVLGLYALGNVIKCEFGSESGTMKLAVEAWKEAVALQRQFWAIKYNGINPEDYVVEIQKVEPTYIMPKKAGCVTFDNMV